tara:strand:- start:52 stop:519 length:468 start_codon:yes stop_codon:yes gene_type:complete
MSFERMDFKKKEKPDAIKEPEDQPEYQEKIMFLVSTSFQAAILTWCLAVLSLGYLKLPNRMFGMDIPDQPRVDSTFAAGLLGNILAGWGVSVGAGGAGKKKKKEGENGGVGTMPMGGGYQTIIVKQPIELITRQPDVIRVDPVTGKNVQNDGRLT